MVTPFYRRTIALVGFDLSSYTLKPTLQIENDRTQHRNIFLVPHLCIQGSKEFEPSIPFAC
jgi:hypothetical protein